MIRINLIPIKEIVDEERKANGRARNKRYYYAHREKSAENHKKFVAKNKEKIKEYNKAYCKKYREEKKEQLKEKQKKWREENKEIVSERKKLDFEKNKEKRMAKKKEWREKNKEHCMELQKKYREANRALIRQRKKEIHKIRLASDPAYIVEMRIRRRLHIVLRRQQAGKKTRWKDFGYSAEELAAHLESKFLPGMTWENRSKWHIDHIVPLSAFDLSDPAQVIAANQLSNLQPLWAIDNLRKGSKIIEVSSGKPTDQKF